MGRSIRYVLRSVRRNIIQVSKYKGLEQLAWLTHYRSFIMYTSYTAYTQYIEHTIYHNIRCSEYISGLCKYKTCRRNFCQNRGDISNTSIIILIYLFFYLSIEANIM